MPNKLGDKVLVLDYVKGADVFNATNDGITIRIYTPEEIAHFQHLEDFPGHNIVSTQYTLRAILDARREFSSKTV